MNETDDKHCARFGVRGPVSADGTPIVEEDVRDARLQIADLALGFIEALLNEPPDEDEDRVDTSQWPTAVREQIGYEAACLALGVMDGTATCKGASRQSLDRSLREGLRVGRTLALDSHRDEGCPGCSGSAAVLAMLEAN